MSKTKKKIMIIIVVILVLFAFINVLMLGIMGGAGPFGFIKTNKIKKLPGNAEEYRPENTSAMENSPLQGKRICFLGSSVTLGATSLDNSMAEYLGRRFDSSVVKEAVSGTTLVDNGKTSYIQRMLTNIDKNEDYSLFICQLSTNDASKKLPLGKITESKDLASFDTTTIAGAMEYIICYVQETWACPMMFYTGTRYDSVEYREMVELLPHLQEKWGIGVIDLWNEDAFNNITADERSLYMQDDIHPTMAGYRDWWVPEMEKQILNYIN